MENRDREGTGMFTPPENPPQPAKFALIKSAQKPEITLFWNLRFP